MKPGMPRAWLRILILGLFLVGALRVAQVWEGLPATMASHFGGGGAPNAFMDRQSFFAFYAVINAFVVALLLGVSVLLAKLPPRLINLPAREHWLAPERRDATIERLGRAFDVYALWTAAFSLGVLELVLRANLSGAGLANGAFMAMLVAYMLFTLGWTVWLLLTLRPPAPSSE